MAQLCQVVLDDDVTKPGTLHTPRAGHKARRMSKILYSIKICLFEEQISAHVLPRGTVTTHQQEKLKQFVVLLALCIVIWWLKCQSSSNSPQFDLCLYKIFPNYKAANLIFSSSTVKDFDRHLWCLTPEIIVLALFSNAVPQNVRRAVADVLMATQPEMPSTLKHRYGSG